MTSAQDLKQLLGRAKSPVFFGGAGVSTESGIPDFRSQGGLYNQSYKYPPEQILSRSFFNQNTAEFYRFYREKMLIDGALPNPAHLYLAANNIPVITQNIDGLHSLAASGDYWNPMRDQIFELHGSVHRNFCQQCGAKFGLEIFGESDLVPKCDRCQGVVKPDVILYEEPLNSEVWNRAAQLIDSADLLIVGGTSLTVYPASSLVRAFRGSHLVLINRDETTADNSADLVIREPIGKIFSEISN